VSLRWLLDFIVRLYEESPDDLNFGAKPETDKLLIYTVESEGEIDLFFVDAHPR